MAAAPRTIDEYIAGFPEDVQKILRKVRATIRKAAPGVEEAVKYGVAAFVLDGTNLIFFGGYKQHIGVYPAPRAAEEFREELAAYKGGKGTVQFPLDQPIPYELITRIVKYRVRENRPNKASKRR
jgi:uncharacterized protein YdhG (YjbR/CyaY superfamily)